jgi:hypothetical protein
MILLYKKIEDGKIYYVKGIAWTYERKEAAQFKTMAEVYDIVKRMEGNYDSLYNLGIEWIDYTIIVGDYRLADTWYSSEEAELICEGLNTGLNIKVFKIKENIFLDTQSFLMKECVSRINYYE